METTCKASQRIQALAALKWIINWFVRRGDKRGASTMRRTARLIRERPAIANALAVIVLANHARLAAKGVAA